MALYGLSLFNLHYWGFGIPFIIGGSWYLVRSYRLSEKLKLAKADAGPDGPRGPAGARPRPSKRYTPPTAPPDGAVPSRARGWKRADRRPGPGRPAGSTGTLRHTGVDAVVAPRPSVPSARADGCSSHTGNTDVTVPKSPPCIVCGGKPKLPVLPLVHPYLVDGAGWP